VRKVVVGVLDADFVMTELMLNINSELEWLLQTEIE